MKEAHQITFDFSVPPEAEKEEELVHTHEPEAPLPKKRGRKPRDPSTIIKKLPSKRGRKSLKEVVAEADMIEIPEDEILFRKQYYSMSEVADMFHINHSLLRFWEKEFDVLQPRKNKKGDRFFRPADIKSLHLIHHLLRQRKYTMEGAKEYLKKNHSTADKKFEMIQSLERIKTFLLEVRSNLD